MARQKITEPEQGIELEVLTEQEQLFCEGLLKGLKAAEAYRQAFEKAKDYKPNTIWKEASLLKSSRKVQEWLNAAMQAGFADTKVTVEGHLEELAKLREIAKASGNLGAAVQAEQLRGKASGFYVERFRDETEKMSDEDLVAAAREVLGKEMGDSAAIALGLKTVQ